MATYPVVPIACRPGSETFRNHWRRSTSTSIKSTPEASASATTSKSSPPRIWRPCPDPEVEVPKKVGSQEPENGRESGGVRVGVKAASQIPPLTVVGPFQPVLPIGINASDDSKTEHFIKVVLKGETLVAKTEGLEKGVWMTYVLPARDRHEQNVEALRDARGLVYFRTIKAIRPGEELLVWYGEELALECGIPTLNPANIKGDQQYTCVVCKQCFLYPNSLKAHMRFFCAGLELPSSCPDPSLRKLSQLGMARFLMLQQQQQQLYQQQQQLHQHHHHQQKQLQEQRRRDLIHQHEQEKEQQLQHQRQQKEQFQQREKRRSSTSPAQTPSPLNGHHPHHRGDDLGKVKTDKPTLSQSPSTGVKPPGSDVGKKPSTTSMLYPQTAMDHSSWLSAYSYLYGKYSLPKVLPSQYMAMYNFAVPGNAQESFPAALQQPCPRQPNSTDSTPESRLGQRRDSQSLTPPTREEGSPVGGLPGFSYPIDVSKEPIDMLPKSLYMNKAFKGHLCIYCGKLYSRKYGLKIHLRTHTGYKPLKCKVCSRPFGDPSNLNKHIRLHAEGETPYRCEFCGKVLVRRRDLERHIKSRHPLECGNRSHGAIEDSDVIVDIESCDDLQCHGQDDTDSD